MVTGDRPVSWQPDDESEAGAEVRGAPSGVKVNHPARIT